MEKERYYLRLYDVSFEVTKEQYVDYYRERRRAKYLEEADMAHELTYYQALDTDRYLGEELIHDEDMLPEDIIENKEMLKKLRLALEQLNDKERELVEEIFFKGKTEKTFAVEIGELQQTIHYRKKQILKKLKSFLEN